MTMEQTNTHRERVAVGCLCCYNEGRLTYQHLDADELEKAWESGNMAAHVCDRPVTIYHNPEEWHIQDYDGEIGRVSQHLGEHPDIPNLIECMRLFEDEASRYVPAFLFAVEHLGETPTAEQVESMAMEMMWTEDVEDHFREQAYDCGYIKDGDHLASYIDWKHYARDQMYYHHSMKYGEYTYLIPHGVSI